MNVVLPAVMSADGRITKGDILQPGRWRSAEDETFFSQLIKRYKVMVMGRKTYEATQPKPTPGVLRLVLTPQPQRFADRHVTGQLEFMRFDSPQDVADYLEKQGYQDMLLVGGASLHADFLQARLVNELYLTLEPLLFGAGLPLIRSAVDVQLQLIESKQLNPEGTLLLHYRVAR